MRETVAGEGAGVEQRTVAAGGAPAPVPGEAAAAWVAAVGGAEGFAARLRAASAQTVTYDPTSTARLVGMQKCWLTSLMLRARPMNSLSCQLGISG